ncbi:MAG: hypothetical protein L0Z62_07370 [Gemmataceae bacterium]|nr:hypothetical protein [Gemmataceae bacterium]
MRRITRVAAVAAALAVLLAASQSASAEDKKAKKKAGKPVRGTVVEVKKDKDDGTIKVKVQVGKKKDPAAPVEEKVFKVTGQTKFEQMVGKKKDNLPAEAATFAAVEAGQVVQLVVKGDTVVSARIAPKKKKKADK